MSIKPSEQFLHTDIQFVAIVLSFCLFLDAYEVTPGFPKSNHFPAHPLHLSLRSNWELKSPLYVLPP